MNEIKYRYGIPTKKSMYEIIDSYPHFKFHNLGPSQLYGRALSTLTWARKREQENIDGFIGYLQELGIEVENYQPYNSPTVGHIQLKRK